jgi:hypothetical protein
VREWLVVSGRSLARSLAIVIPALENTLSDGADITGMLSSL